MPKKKIKENRNERDNRQLTELERDLLEDKHCLPFMLLTINRQLTRIENLMSLMMQMDSSEYYFEGETKREIKKIDKAIRDDQIALYNK